MDDLFESWLKKESNLVNRALTDKSYRKVYQKENKKEYLGETNGELATFGDAIIKFCFCDILLDNVPNISEKKKNYESDLTLVKIIARKYEILKYIKMDKSDDKIPKDYDYVSKKGSNPRKYIATAVEAMIGAIYKETNDLGKIINLIKEWKKEIDANS